MTKALVTDNLLDIWCGLQNKIDSKICSKFDICGISYFRIEFRHDDVDSTYPFMYESGWKNSTPIYSSNNGLKGFKLSNGDEFTLSISGSNIRITGTNINSYNIFINQSATQNGYNKITNGTNYIDITFPNGWEKFTDSIYVLMFRK